MWTEDKMKAASLEELKAEYKRMTSGDVDYSEERNEYIARINKHLTAAARARKKGEVGKGKWKAFKKKADPKVKAKAAKELKKKKAKKKKHSLRYVLGDDSLEQSKQNIKDPKKSKELDSALKERKETKASEAKPEAKSKPKAKPDPERMKLARDIGEDPYRFSGRSPIREARGAAPRKLDDRLAQVKGKTDEAGVDD